MPWQPLPRIAFAVATYPFTTVGENELPLEIGDDLYIIEETPDGQWLRGYLLAPPSLLSGLTSARGQTLEARVFSGIFPRSCVEIREVLGDTDDSLNENDDDELSGHATEPTSTHHGDDDAASSAVHRGGSDSGKSGVASNGKTDSGALNGTIPARQNGANGSLSLRSRRHLDKPLPGEPKPAAPVPMLKIGDETPTSLSEPLIDEIASCLREWHSTHFHELLLSRQYSKLDEVSQLIETLDLARRQFLHNVLTAHEYNALREKTVWNLVKGNKLCGGEVIVRDPSDRGRILTGDDSIVDITKLQSTMSLLDEPPQQHSEATALHHLLVDVKSFAGSSNEPSTLVLYLVNRSVGGTLSNLSENYVVEVPAGGLMGNGAKDSQMRTLFTDLTSTDVGDLPSADSELFLVVKVLAPQHVANANGKPSSRSGSHPPPGSPYGKEKPTSSNGQKTSRRSLMWGSTRSAFSRGGPKLDALSEQSEERPKTTRAESRDGAGPPSTAGSRHGRPSTDGGQSTVTAVERMVGAAVLKLNPIVKQDEESEHLLTVWTPSVSATERSGHGKEHDAFVRDVLANPSGYFEKSKRAERLQLHLRPFSNPNADTLIKATPTLLSGISKTGKMEFSGAPTKPRSDIYFTVSQAFVNRQNLLSRFGSSATSISSSMHCNNLTVSVEVFRQSGERINECIYPSSNSEGLTTWHSFALDRGERWNQTLRLSISPADVLTSHVLLKISDAPGAPFAMAYLPLWDQQAFMSDGPHSLLLYKLDEFTQAAQASSTGRGGYLSLPWSPRDNSSDVTGPLATMRVETYLCSTRFSQDRVVLGLIRWREGPKMDIPTLLKQLIFVPEIEVVKLLSDVLDSLFAILVDYQGNDEYEDLVFTALVRVLGIVHDRRFNLGPLVDQYAETRFNYPFATPCLVRSFTRLLSKPTEPESARKLRATLKVIRHIFKFIAHARGQQKVKEADIGITGSTPSFSRHLHSIFKALESMMRSTAPVLVGSQTLAVQHFHTWLPELAGLLSAEEILHIAIDFLDSCALVKGKLVLYKLVLILNYSKLDIFANPEQRETLCTNTVRWIAPHWGHTDEVTDHWKDQVRLCCSIVASQASSLGNEIPDYIPKIIDSYLAIQRVPAEPRNRLSLLFPTSFPFPSRPIDAEPVAFDEALIELSSVLSALSHSPNGMQLELVDDEGAILLKNTLKVHLSILQGEAFPRSWLSVYIYHHKSAMKTLQYISAILQESFLPDPDDAETFDTELWRMFFTTLLKLVGSECLALETFPEQKRRTIWKIAGDVREHGAELLRRTWESIGWETSPDERSRYGLSLSKMGGYQVQYVPTLVGPIVELCLSVHEGLRKMAVEVLQTMMVSEWTLSEDLSVIQTEMIDYLDSFFQDRAVTESILQKLFIRELVDKFEPLSRLEDDPMHEALKDLVATLEEFLDLLVAVHSGDVAGEASHLINRLRLMEFLRDMQKEGIFIRYVHQLATLQAESRNHTEAGLALRLHADLYDWDPTTTAPALQVPALPAQSNFERKERIYFDMIKHFEDGEAWSSALAAYKELQAQYESNVFDFPKLARTERAIATIYETLAKTEKLVPKYFKVVYKGLGFPIGLRDKAFVYEGTPTERTSAFTDRMQEQHQSAQIITSGDIESEIEGQYLVISAISPHRDLGHTVFQRTRVPNAIRDYLLSANPQKFSISSKRNTAGPVTEHHAEKIIHTTAEVFPTILRRSEIVDTQIMELSAKETALERIVRKTQEMSVVEKRLNEGEQSVAQLLVDAIRISVSPDSENSIAAYRELLPSPKAPQSDDEDDEDDDEDDDDEEDEIELDRQEQAIKMSLIDHAMMIKRCLMSFSRSSNPILTKGYEDLYKHFEVTYAAEIAVLTPSTMSRDMTSASVPSSHRTSPNGHSPHPSKARNSLINGSGVVEEAAAAQPMSVKQRGTRLSFLGGKKKESSQSGETTNSTPPRRGSEATSGSRISKDNLNRRSFFKSHPSDPSDGHADHGQSNGTSSGSSAPDWVQDRVRKTQDIIDVVDKSKEGQPNGTSGRGGPGLIGKKGSIRKRFSELKLGTKKSKYGMMAGVEEEQQSPR